MNLLLLEDKTQVIYIYIYIKDSFDLNLKSVMI
jgi:hypothetical protein